MSLNELVDQNSKNWLRLRCNDLIVDGDIKPPNPISGNRLTYIGNGNATFQSPNNQNTTTGDKYRVQPTTISADNGALTPLLSELSETNFSLSTIYLTCQTVGTYFITWSIGLDGINPFNTRLRTYIAKNDVYLGYGEENFPIIPVSSLANSGINMFGSVVVTLAINDTITLRYNKTPSSTASIGIVPSNDFNIINLIKII